LAIWAIALSNVDLCTYIFTAIYIMYKGIRSYDDASKAMRPPERQATLPPFNEYDALPK